MIKEYIECPICKIKYKDVIAHIVNQHPEILKTHRIVIKMEMLEDEDKNNNNL